jgi:hypothetical protein
MRSAINPPARGPTAADRIWADWIEPTARPVCSRGAPDVAMASPSGPMPPNRPTPARRANSWPTLITNADSAISTT